jgi:hypothetical protein
MRCPSAYICSGQYKLMKYRDVPGLDATEKDTFTGVPGDISVNVSGREYEPSSIGDVTWACVIAVT